MGFINETANLLGIDSKTKTQTFCYISPANGIVVEGYKKLYELSDSKITILCEEGKRMEIIGKNLKIKEIAHREISINGAITCVEFI